MSYTATQKWFSFLFQEGEYFPCCLKLSFYQLHPMYNMVLISLISPANESQAGLQMQFGKVKCYRVGKRVTVNPCVERRLLLTWWLC